MPSSRGSKTRKGRSLRNALMNGREVRLSYEEAEPALGQGWTYVAELLKVEADEDDGGFVFDEEIVLEARSTAGPQAALEELIRKMPA